MEEKLEKVKELLSQMVYEELSFADIYIENNEIVIVVPDYTYLPIVRELISDYKNDHLLSYTNYSVGAFYETTEGIFIKVEEDCIDTLIDRLEEDID